MSSQGVDVQCIQLAVSQPVIWAKAGVEFVPPAHEAQSLPQQGRHLKLPMAQQCALSLSQLMVRSSERGSGTFVSATLVVRVVQ